MIDQITHLVPKLFAAAILTAAFCTFYWRSKIDDKIKRSLAIFIPATIFICCITCLTCNVPYSDDYAAIISYAAQDFPDRLKGIFAFHNEHRIAFTRLIAELSFALFGCIDFRLFIFIASILMLGIVLLLSRRFKHADATYLFVPFVWLLLDWFNWENPLWAMAGVQNIGVLLFAFLSFLFADRDQSTKNFLLALSFSAIATITSGQGILSWFCLVGLLSRNIICHKEEKPKAVAHLLITILCSILASALFFHNFPHTSPSTQARSFSVFNAADFLLSYSGGVIPIHIVALPIGILTTAIIIWAAFAFHRHIDNTILAFAAFLFGNFFAGALFRSEPIGLALCFRYAIVSTLLFGCSLLLLHQLTPNVPLAHKHKIGLLICAGAFFVNFAAMLLGYPIFANRKTALVAGIEKFPEDVSGLFIGPFDNAKAISDLSTCVNSGRYRPPKTR